MPSNNTSAGFNANNPLVTTPGNVIDLLLRRQRLRNRKVVHIKNDIAVVSHHALAVDRIAAKLHQLPSHMTACHGNNLHRQRKFTQGVYQLALVGNADKFSRHRRHNFFPGQRRTAALD